MQKYLCIIFLIIFSSLSFGQKSLSLNEAIQIALQRNTNLERAENSIKSYESSVLSAYGNFLPNVSASGSFNWSKSEDAGGTVYFAGFAIPVESRITEDRSYSAGVQGNLVIFDGLANISSLSRSRNELESFKYTIERLKQDVIFQTIESYYMVLNGEQLVKFREDDVAWNQKNFETVSERNRLGAVTLADVYAQQVRLGNSELELIRAKNNLETAKSNLLYYLGLDVMTEYNFTDTVSDKDFEDIGKELRNDYSDLRELVERALDNRFDYRSARLTLQSAENSIAIARSGHLPRLSGTVGYNLRANRLEDLKDSRTFYAGLTLSIPIFSGFDTYNQVQIAEVNVENRQVELNDLRRSIRQNIQTTFRDLQASEKALEVSSRNIEAAEENRRIEQEKYTLGSGTILNVLIANSEYQNAQTIYINAQFDYLTLSEQLKYLVGTLDYKKFE